MKNWKLVFLPCILLFVLSKSIYADTIFFKNGEEKKGIVVEEYIDRIILSTTDGEKEISKVNIKDILYDRPVQNLIKLGDFHREKGNLTRSYTYYRKAYQLDPSYEPAITRYVEASSILLKQPQERLQERINKQRALLQTSRGITKIKEGISAASEAKLKEVLGIELISKDEKPYISKVFPKSPAYEYGIMVADCVMAVWNKLTKYMQLTDVCDIILNTSTGEVKLTIERDITFTKDNSNEYSGEGVASLGMYLDITNKGLVISRIVENSLAGKCGLLGSDVISKIDDEPTRYMPLKEAINIIESKDKEFSISISRDINLWLRRD